MNRTKSVSKQKCKPPDDSVFIGSRNIFADLGLRNPEETLLKAKLVIEIEKLIQTNGWTRAQISKKLGLDRAKISAILRGRLRDFSFEQLLRYVNRLGQEVEVTMRPIEALSTKARR